MNCKKFKDQIFMFQDSQLADRSLANGKSSAAIAGPALKRSLRVEAAASRLAAAAEPVPGPDCDKSWRKIAAAVKPRPAAKFSFLFSPRLALLSAAF